MWRRYSWLESDGCGNTNYAQSGVGGTGSMGTLPMTEEELTKVVKKPLGFTAEFPKKRRRKT